MANPPVGKSVMPKAFPVNKGVMKQAKPAVSGAKFPVGNKLQAMARRRLEGM